jgi:hypothetical protein
MTDASWIAYRYWSAIVFAAVIVQIGAAGYGAFYAYNHSDKSKLLTHKQFDHGFSFHIALGYLLFVGTVFVFLFALGARLGRRRVMQSLAAPVLVVAAILLAQAGEHVPAVGVFHPLVAFLIAGLTGSMAFQAWRGKGHAGTGG